MRLCPIIAISMEADQILHLGNLLVQVGPRLVLLDHRLTVPLVPSLVEALKKMVQALSTGDFVSLVGALTEAGLQFDGQVDIAILLHLIGVLLGKEQADETTQDVDAVDAGMQIGKSIGTIPVDVLLVGRALGPLDGITKQLDPSLDTIEISELRSAEGKIEDVITS